MRFVAWVRLQVAAMARAVGPSAGREEAASAQLAAAEKASARWGQLTPPTSSRQCPSACTPGADSQLRGTGCSTLTAQLSSIWFARRRLRDDAAPLRRCPPAGCATTTPSCRASSSA